MLEAFKLEKKPSGPGNYIYLYICTVSRLDLLIHVVLGVGEGKGSQGWFCNYSCHIHIFKSQQYYGLTLSHFSGSQVKRMVMYMYLYKVAESFSRVMRHIIYRLQYCCYPALYSKIHFSLVGLVLMYMELPALFQKQQGWQVI